MKRISTSTLDDANVAPWSIEDAGCILKYTTCRHARAKRRILLLTIVAERMTEDECRILGSLLPTSWVCPAETKVAPFEKEARLARHFAFW